MVKSLPLGDVTFVVVDIETTGSAPARHAMTEIGAVKIQGQKIVDRFDQLMDPKQDIPWFIQRLTGITPKMVKGAPPVEAVLPRFMDFLGDSIFVAHNVSFDFGFVAAKTQAHMGLTLENIQLCTCRLARKLLPDLKKKNLGAVAQYMGIPIENRHRALGDAQATALVLIEFIRILETAGLTTLDDLMDPPRLLLDQLDAPFRDAEVEFYMRA